MLIQFDHMPDPTARVSKNLEYLKLTMNTVSNLISHAMAKTFMSYEVTSWKLGQLESGITTGPIWDFAAGDMTKLLPDFSQMLVNCKSGRTVLRSTYFLNTAQYTRIFFFFRNMVHHFWCYKGLADREAVRAQAWEHADWSKHVRNTVSIFNTEQ